MSGGRAAAAAATLIAAAALGGAKGPTAPEPTLVPARPSAGPGLAARRFLEIYVRAYAGRLAPTDRTALAKVAAASVAEPLVEQPPERPLPGGRIRGLALVAGAADARATARLRLGAIALGARLRLSAYPDGRWRVTQFAPRSQSLLNRRR